MVHGELTVIDNRDGDRITPSVVCFNKESGQTVVGANGILAAQTSPENFVYEAKRMIGKGYWDSDIQKNMEYWPFQLKEIKASSSDIPKEKQVDNIGIVITVGGKEQIYEPIQISAAVLNYLAESAKTRLNGFPNHVVITVPAYFHDGAKQRTLGAAKIAFANKKDANNNPLEVNTILLAEPTAAAMAYGSKMISSKLRKDGDSEKILVFDLGGGTYDVSILEFNYDAQNPIGEVKATDGDNYLGGGDFDNIIIKMAKDEYAAAHPNDLTTGGKLDDLKNDIRLRQEAIKVKSQLSTNTNVTFALSCFRGSNGINFEVSRNKFERAGKKLFDRLLEKVKGVLLSYSKVNPVYTDDGYLNYGETQSQNRDVLAKKTIDGLISESKGDIDRIIMVGGSSRIPKVKAILEGFFGETSETPDSKKKVVSVLNPDESIAFGAGYYANASSPDADETDGPKLLLIDNVPLNLNIETFGGVATPVIKATTAIPAKNTQVFTTAADNQTTVSIVITQGNRTKTADNHLIGSFNLNGIAAAKRGEPQIEVTFDVDHNNILKVTACDKKTGSKEIFVQNMNEKLTDDDIERMKKVAAEHEKTDQLFKDRTEAKNSFENMVYSLADKVDELKCDAAVKANLEAKIKEANDYLNGPANEAEPAEIKAKSEEFGKSFGEMLQQASSGQQGETSNNNAAPNADVEEVN